jgi:hypothetical protein
VGLFWHPCVFGLFVVGARLGISFLVLVGFISFFPLFIRSGSGHSYLAASNHERKTLKRCIYSFFHSAAVFHASFQPPGSFIFKKDEDKNRQSDCNSGGTTFVFLAASKAQVYRLRRCS